MQIHFQSQSSLYKTPKTSTVNTANNTFTAPTSANHFDQVSFSNKSSNVLFGADASKSPKSALIGDKIRLSNGEELSIVPCKTADDMKRGYWAVAEADYEAHGKGSAIHFIDNHMDEAQQYIDTDLATKRTVLHQVRDANGRVVGVSSFYPYTDPKGKFDAVLKAAGYEQYTGSKKADDTKTANLLDFYMVRQNQGIGGPMLKYAEAELKRLGYTAVVASSNAIHEGTWSVYSKGGFQEIGDIDTPAGPAKVFFKILGNQPKSA